MVIFTEWTLLDQQLLN